MCTHPTVRVKALRRPQLQTRSSKIVSHNNKIIYGTYGNMHYFIFPTV